jgi:hypothetical protein
MKFKTLAIALSKVGVPGGRACSNGLVRHIDLGHGAGLTIFTDQNSNMTLVVACDVTNGIPAHVDATRWTSNVIAAWASQRYAGRRVIRGLNVADAEYWFQANVSRKHLERSGAPADVLEPVGANVRYVLSFTDEVAAVTTIPI